jgi:hypothetical protein
MMVEHPTRELPQDGALPRGESSLESFAEDLSRLLGTAEAKTTAWLDQRKAMLKQLIAVRDKAEALIRILTVQDLSRGQSAEQRSTDRPVKPSPRGKRTSSSAISPEGRARISAAQKRRWERHRAAANKARD